MASPRKPSAKFYVYRITNEVNGLLYIGKAKNPERRWTVHKWYAASFDSYLYRAMRKYGIENFTFKVLSSHTTEKEAFAEEVRVIKAHSTFGIGGYNQTSGGEGGSGHTLSTEAREKISAAHLGRKATPAARAALRAAHKHTKTNLGRKWSDEVKKNMSLAHLGAKLGTLQKKRIGDALRGRPKSAEHREAYRKAFTLERRAAISAQMSRPKSMETRRRMSETLLPKVLLTAAKRAFQIIDNPKPLEFYYQYR